MTAKRKNRKHLFYPRPWMKMGFIALTLALVGCSGTYGNFVYDAAVDQIFEELEVLPDHRYYFSGPESFPNAIIAIDTRYTLVSDFWKPIEMTSAQLKDWIFDHRRRVQYVPYTYGRYMLNDDGERFGLWYSLKDWRDFATIRILDDNRIQVSTPFDQGSRRRPSKYFNNHYDDD